MIERERIAIEVARRYYLEGEGMPELAAAYGVSRSTISRLITMARERDWVRIEIIDPASHETEAVRSLRQRFGLDWVVSVPMRPNVDMINAVGLRAADHLGQTIEDNQTIGVAWGTTTAAIASQLRPTGRAGCRVVQLNGAGSHRDFELDYSVHIVGQFCAAWNATAVHFPVPAFFDDPDTRVALWKERSVQRVLREQEACDAAIFSVGSTEAERPSRVYAAGYLSASDLRQLAVDGAVGDIATHFYDRHGKADGIRINRRASGMPPDRLRMIPHRYCVAVGVGKTAALLAALRGRYVTRLIADSALLHAVADASAEDETVPCR